MKDKEILNRKKILREARKYYKRNKLHLAEKVLLKLIHHGYRDPEVKYQLALTYDKLAYLTSESEFEDNAFELYDELINYSDKRKFRRKAGKSLNRLAKRTSELNENDHKAKEKAFELGTREPKSPKAWFILGANFSVRKDPFFVLDAYKNAIKLCPDYILAIYRAAYIYQYNLNDTDRALKYYLKLIKTDPLADGIETKGNNIKTIIEACGEISDIYIRKKDYSRVISIFDHAISFYLNYQDLVNVETMKKLLLNTITASKRIQKLESLNSYIKNNYNLEIKDLSLQLRIPCTI